MTKRVAELTERDCEVCKLASELSGAPNLLPPWAFENALYRAKIGESVPDHIMRQLDRAWEKLHEKGETAE